MGVSGLVVFLSCVVLFASPFAALSLCTPPHCLHTRQLQAAEAQHASLSLPPCLSSCVRYLLCALLLELPALQSKLGWLRCWVAKATSKHALLWVRLLAHACVGFWCVGLCSMRVCCVVKQQNAHKPWLVR